MKAKVIGAVAAILLGAAGMAQADITIDTVTVGNAGNAGEVQTQGTFGAVSYAYNIGKYEVTAGQYTAFLTAVAATDTYGLYNPNMWSQPAGCKIQRTGTSGIYTYSVASDYANRPVNFVSFWDSCRFANWLQNDQATGAQGAGMTETGAYTLSSDGILAYDPTLYIITITRNPGTTWAVTSENEWYKAAYYNPAAGNYYLYPTSSDSAPGNDMADVSHNNANIRTGSGTYPIDSGKYTTLVGEFENSASPYGTFDQGGNVFEWNEVNQEASSYLALRGGSLFFDASFMPSTKRLFIKPKEESLDIGFRVSEVPEPATLSLLALGGLAALRRRRRMA